MKGMSTSAKICWWLGIIFGVSGLVGLSLLSDQGIDMTHDPQTILTTVSNGGFFLGMAIIAGILHFLAGRLVRWKQWACVFLGGRILALPFFFYALYRLGTHYGVNLITLRIIAPWCMGSIAGLIGVTVLWAVVIKARKVA